MNEIEELKAEIRRLQGILDDNEISYELEAFGPPNRPLRDEVRMLCRGWLKISSTLRVRPRIDYRVSR
jgi:hypothetical protein